LSDVEAKLLAVESWRESGVTKPVPRPSLEVEVEGESSMECVNSLLLQTAFRPQMGVEQEVGGEREIGGPQSRDEVGGVVRKRGAVAVCRMNETT